MTTSPDSSLPMVQTLAGLFSGLVNARQQQMQNPRYGFSMLPILAGGAQGLATGMAGAASRAEELRQEQRKSDDAIAQMAYQSGQTPEQVKARLGGMTPTEYRANVGDAGRQGMGNIAAGQQMNIASPNGLFAMDNGVLGTMIGKAQDQLADTATTNALPQAQQAGAYDGGGNQTDNALQIPRVPSIAALLGPQHQAMMKALGMDTTGPQQAIPQIKFVGQPVPGNPPAQGAQVPVVNPDGSTRVYSAPPPSINGALTGGVQASPSGVPVSQDTGVDLGFPKTFAQIAMQAKYPAIIAGMYGHAANAVNARNTQDTSRINTAQTVNAANQREVLNSQTLDSPSKIIANGTPQQKNDLQNYAEASATKLSGIQKPPTFSEMQAATKSIQNAPTPEGRKAAADLAVQTNRLTPEQADAALKGSIFSQPAGVSSPAGDTSNVAPGLGPAGDTSNVAPGLGPAVAPRISDFMTPSQYPNIQMVQSANLSSVNKKARENNGSSGRTNKRNYGY